MFHVKYNSFLEPKKFDIDVLSSSLMDSNVSLKWKQRKSKEFGARPLAHNILGAEGHARAPDGTRKNDKHLITHTNLQKTKRQVG